MAHHRGPRRSTVLSARGSWSIAPRTPGRCAPSGSSVVARSDPTTMMNWTSLRAFERGYAAGAPIRVIPRIGSAYKPKGYSSHPPNPLSILLVFFRDNHYRCSYLSESRTTTTVRSTSNIGACPVVPPTRAVTDKVNRLLTLSRVCSEELDFRTTGYPSATNSTKPAAHRWNTHVMSFR